MNESISNITQGDGCQGKSLARRDMYTRWSAGAALRCWRRSRPRRGGPALPRAGVWRGDSASQSAARMQASCCMGERMGQKDTLKFLGHDGDKSCSQITLTKSGKEALGSARLVLPTTCAQAPLVCARSALTQRTFFSRLPASHSKFLNDTHIGLAGGAR